MSLRMPLPGEYADHFAPYLSEAGDGDVLLRLEAQLDEVASLFKDVPEAQGGFRYAPGKWSLKDLVQHLSDAERIFAYRSLRIGRGDTTPLPGFDEDSYAAAAHADARPLAELLTDWQAARRASLALFRSLSPADWLRQGTSSNHSLTARCIPYICAGHTAHHLAVIRGRYLSALK